MINIPNLGIDRDGDEPDTHVLLTQDDMAGTVHYVTLHPIQVRLLAERMGLLAPSSNIEADRTIARLGRQMRVLVERIDAMDDMFLDIGAKGHECVEEECAYSAATLDIAREFLCELPLDGRGQATAPNTPESGAVPTGNPPKSGGVARANPPKSGGVAAQGQLALPAGEATR